MWGTAKCSIQNKITDDRMRGTSSMQGWFRKARSGSIFHNIVGIMQEIKFLLSHVHGLDGIVNCIWQVFE